MSYEWAPLGIVYAFSPKKTPLEKDIYRLLKNVGHEVSCTSTYGEVDWNEIGSLTDGIENGLSAYGKDGRLYLNFLAKWEDQKDTIKLVKKS